MLQTELDSLANVATVFAHSVVYFAREKVGSSDLFAWDDSDPTGAAESTDQQMQAYIKNLPQLLDVTSSQILPVEQRMLAARQALSPQQSQLELDQYSKFGPQFAQVGSDIAKQNALNQAGTDLSVLQGPGKSLAREAMAVQREADPEYYAAREQAMAALSKLFGSMDDPNGPMSGAEREEITRSLARDNAARGNEFASGMGAVENALKFGRAGEDRKANKQARLASAIGSAAGFMPAAQSKVDTFQLTTGRPAFNFGEQRNTGPVQNVGQNTFGMGSQLFNQTGAYQQQANDNQYKKRDALDRFVQGWSGVVGSIF